MPGPLDLLKHGYKFATTPLVDESTIQPAQDWMDSPTMDRSPMEARIRGFGAGALEGLRGLTTPLDLAAMASGPALGALRGAMGASKAIAPTMDLIEANPVRQVAGSMDDVDAVIGDARRMMAKVPNKRPMPMETLGESAAEFTPMGGEAMYNVGKGVGQPGGGMDGLYNLMMKRFGGRGQ